MKKRETVRYDDQWDEEFPSGFFENSARYLIISLVAILFLLLAGFDAGVWVGLK